MITLLVKFRHDGRFIRVSANNSPNLLALAMADAPNCGIPYHMPGYPTLTTVRQAMQDAVNAWDGNPGEAVKIVRKDFEVVLAKKESRPATVMGEAR